MPRPNPTDKRRRPDGKRQVRTQPQTRNARCMNACTDATLPRRQALETPRLRIWNAPRPLPNDRTDHAGSGRNQARLRDLPPGTAEHQRGSAPSYGVPPGAELALGGPSADGSSTARAVLWGMEVNRVAGPNADLFPAPAIEAALEDLPWPTLGPCSPPQTEPLGCASAIRPRPPGRQPTKRVGPPTRFVASDSRKCENGEVSESCAFRNSLLLGPLQLCEATSGRLGANTRASSFSGAVLCLLSKSTADTPAHGPELPRSYGARNQPKRVNRQGGDLRGSSLLG